MKVVMFRGRGVLSWIIRVQTRGDWSHCGILDDDGRLYEAWQGKGVRVRDGIKPGPGVAFYNFVPPLTENEKNRMRTYLRSQIGKGYDLRGALAFKAAFRFLAQDKDGDENKLFCSEYLFSAAVAAHRWLFKETKAHEVSPQMIPRSPGLERAFERVLAPEGADESGSTRNWIEAPAMIL